MLKILVLLAGQGNRFASKEYSWPKPFLPIHDKTMVAFVAENLTPKEIECEFLFVCRKDHYEKYDLENILKNATAGHPYKIIQSNGVTKGAACSALLASEFIDENPLVISNADQFVEPKAMAKWYWMLDRSKELDGQIMVCRSEHPKWSYVRLNDKGLALEVAEKRVISPWASTGIYFWANGLNFIESAKEMIRKDIRTNGEFYLAPTYNELILQGKKIGVVEVSNEDFHGCGTPEDYEHFIKNFKYL